ncbi:MAG TPA: translation elongation factor Ts [Chloroflexota bacterium]|nr:translation elongation factor Ts [Chloroflexota bacterium]
MSEQIPTEAIKSLREATGAGVMDCKRALSEAQGDVDKAKTILRERGLVGAEKKSGRETREGLIESYIHGGRIGALIEVNCETDFVARTDEFKELVRDLVRQVAAMNPRFLSAEEAPADVVREEGLSPQEVESASLLSQAFIKDPSKTIGQLITEVVAKTGENIRVRRFARFELGK